MVKLGLSIGYYDYCIPFSKMQDDDGKWETISFVPDNNGVSLCPRVVLPMEI